jgi:hypothetical protein
VPDARPRIWLRAAVAILASAPGFADQGRLTRPSRPTWFRHVSRHLAAVLVLAAVRRMPLQ